MNEPEGGWAPLEPEPRAPAVDAPAPAAYSAPSRVDRPTGGDERTGPLPLHPMTVSDILDGAFKLLKANFRTIVIVTAVFVVPVDVAASFLGRHATVNFSAVFSRTSSTQTGVELPVAYWLLQRDINELWAAYDARMRGIREAPAAALPVPGPGLDPGSLPSYFADAPSPPPPPPSYP